MANVKLVPVGISKHLSRSPTDSSEHSLPLIRVIRKKGVRILARGPVFVTKSGEEREGTALRMCWVERRREGGVERYRGGKNLPCQVQSHDLLGSFPSSGVASPIFNIHSLHSSHNSTGKLFENFLVDSQIIRNKSCNRFQLLQPTCPRRKIYFQIITKGSIEFFFFIIIELSRR